MQTKILLVSYRLGYSSLLYWDGILSSIKENYNNFRVFTAWPSLATQNNELCTEELLNGVKYYHNKDKISQKLFFIPLPFFIYHIYKNKPDLIILNEFNFANVYTLFFKFLYKKSSFLLLVESDPAVGRGGYKHTFFRKVLRKYIVNGVDEILTNNILGSDYLTSELNADQSKLNVLPYLTSCPPSKSCQIAENVDDIVNLLFVGQLVERKGIIYLLKALSQLPLVSQNKLSVKIVGDGSLRAELELIKEKNKLNFVEFTGKISFEEISDLYQKADLFVLPTLHDYRALVGFEAIYFGCALIASVYDGSRFETVKEHRNGFIVDPLNVTEFSSAIDTLVMDRKLLEIYKNNSIEISKNYSLERCNSNLLSVIEKLV
jgi:glycosyltransferase involved in cell wall biosynthesis